MPGTIPLPLAWRLSLRSLQTRLASQLCWNANVQRMMPGGEDLMPMHGQGLRRRLWPASAALLLALLVSAMPAEAQEPV